jgi:membrane-bound lytic murein transglycosylase MltF
MALRVWTRNASAESVKQGLNPNVWFNNGERVAAQKIGRETATCVSNIYNYYIACTLVQQEFIERREAREALQKQ